MYDCFKKSLVFEFFWWILNLKLVKKRGGMWETKVNDNFNLENRVTGLKKLNAVAGKISG